MFFLERGNKTDHYDFLELYLRSWQQQADATYNACKKRRLLKEDGSDNEDEVWANEDDLDEKLSHDASDNHARRGLKANGPQMMTYDYFNRSYNPYDWMERANTEVRYYMFNSIFYNTLPYFVVQIQLTMLLCTVLLSLSRIYGGASMLSGGALACDEELGACLASTIGRAEQVAAF